MISSNQCKQFLSSLNSRTPPPMNCNFTGGFNSRVLDRPHHNGSFILPSIEKPSRPSTVHNQTVILDQNVSVDHDTSQIMDENSKENRANLSFDVDRAQFKIRETKIKSTFTRTFMHLYKEEGVNPAIRERMKAMTDEEKKELLMLRLEEIRRNKENIIKQIAENYKDMAEKEKFMEKIKKMANEAATRIQKFWRRQLIRMKTQRGIVQSCAIERQYQIIKSATEKLLKLSNFVQQHRDKITNVQNIITIQRNARKFLARRKFRILWRRKIANFLEKKLIENIENSVFRDTFRVLKSLLQVKETPDVAFFITTNINTSYNLQTEYTGESSSFRHHNCRSTSPMRVGQKKTIGNSTNKKNHSQVSDSIDQSKSSLCGSNSKDKMENKPRIVNNLGTFEVIQNIKEITSEELSDTECSPKFKNNQKAPLNSPKSKKKENQPIQRRYHKAKTQGDADLPKPKEFRAMPDKRRPLGEKNSSSTMASKDVIPMTGSTLEHHEAQKVKGWKCSCNKCK